MLFTKADYEDLECNLRYVIFLSNVWYTDDWHDLGPKCYFYHNCMLTGNFCRVFRRVYICIPISSIHLIWFQLMMFQRHF